MTKYFTGAKTIEELRKKYRELLKSINFKYAPKKKSWCWHYGDYNRYHKKEVSLDEIRMKYGSRSVNHKSKQYVLN